MKGEFVMFGQKKANEQIVNNINEMYENLNMLNGMDHKPFDIRVEKGELVVEKHEYENLTEDQRKQYDSLPSDAQKHWMEQLQSRESDNYPSNYLDMSQFAKDTATKDGMKDLELLGKLSDPAYINSLTDDQIIDLAKECSERYDIQKDAWKDDVIGVSSDEWNAASYDEKKSLEDKSVATVKKWSIGVAMTDDKNNIADQFKYVDIQDDGTFTKNIDINAGLSEAEKKEIAAIKDSKGQEIRRENMLADKYKDNYLDLKAEDPAMQEAFSQISTLEKMKDPGYLNTLSDEEFDELATDAFAMANVPPTSEGVYGVSADDWEAANDAQRAKYREQSASIKEAWTKELESHEQMNDLHTKQNDLALSKEDKESLQNEYADMVSKNADTVSSEQSKEEQSESPWSNLKERFSRCFETAKEYFQSTAVGKWVTEKVGDIKEFVVDKIGVKERKEEEAKDTEARHDKYCQQAGCPVEDSSQSGKESQQSTDSVSAEVE